MRDVVIIDAKRTAIGNFLGSLKDISAVDFTAQILKKMLEDNKLKSEDIDEVIIGNVLQAGLGQNPARQVAIKSGLDISIPAHTVNKVCGSGLKTVTLAAQAIKCGDAECIIAGGMENMSQSPHYLHTGRTGVKFSNMELVDSMLHDGLRDCFNDYHMGITAENLAEKYSISRDEQDEYAAMSQNRCEKAMNDGKFNDEIIPVEINLGRKKGIVQFNKDEFPRAGVTKEGLGKLRPAFKKDGTVTAANASGINDGAALVIVMSKDKADELGLKPMAYINSYASAGVDPSIMGIGPAESTRKVLKKANMKIEDMDLIEANEAFAVQSLSVAKELGFDNDRVNVNGGAISLGHPIGASGCRILVTLLHEMKRRDSKKGLATLCIGGGMGISMIVERK